MSNQNTKYCRHLAGQTVFNINISGWRKDVGSLTWKQISVSLFYKCCMICWIFPDLSLFIKGVTTLTVTMAVTMKLVLVGYLTVNSQFTWEEDFSNLTVYFHSCMNDRNMPMKNLNVERIWMGKKIEPAESLYRKFNILINQVNCSLSF